MFLHVEQIISLNGYKLRLKFNNGILKDVDLAAQMFAPIFEPLKDPAFFAQVFVNQETNTIEWPNGADFAPEFLDEIGEECKPEQVESLATAV